jgi:hypothetical protein
MNKLTLVLLTFCAFLICWGCQEANVLAPATDQNVPPTAFLSKNVKTTFTGISRFSSGPEPGVIKLLPNGKILVKGKVNEWYDTASDPRVAGKTIWYINAKIERDGSRNVWGRGELIVENGGGLWEMSWHGRISSDFVILDYVYGTGKEGSVKGLVGRWVYNSIPDSNEPTGFYYQFEGYIVDK